MGLEQGTTHTRAAVKTSAFWRAIPTLGWVRPSLPVAILIAIAFALAAGLRLRQGAAPLSFDEFASMYFSDRPFGDLWGWWMVRETNPPLFYSLLKLWRMVLPDSKEALRALPIAISLLQIAILARFAHKTYGGLAAVLCILLFALSPSDIYQSSDIRAYGLAKLAIAVSFVGLAAALSDGNRRAVGWIAYAGGATLAIYSHTTMLLWPAVATAAVLAEAALSRSLPRTVLVRLIAADAVITLLSGWEIAIAFAQLRAHGSNIAWIQPLDFSDYGSSLNLQLLMDGAASSLLMAILIIVGIVRTWRVRVTRLAAFGTIAAIAVFKLADQVHPIVSDFTLHWCANLTVLLAAAALAKGAQAAERARRRADQLAAATTLAVVTALGLVELIEEDWMPQPQDWAYTVRTVARSRNAALLASHESVGLVIEQACRLEFHRPACPFPVVVLANPSQADSWSFGGYGGRMIPVAGARAALGGVETVYAFSRYVYTPLDSLGLDPGDYREVEWDDGELIGPIPIDDFGERRSI